MKKNKWIGIVLLLLAVVSMGLMNGCGQPKEKEIEGIRIVSGSFRESYALDEKMDLNGAYIVATYIDNTTERIKIEPDWLSGFDLSTTGSKTLIVSYRGKQASFIYDVNYKMTITTPVRLFFEHEGEGDSKVVLLSLRETERMPVYAVKLEISLSGLTLSGREDRLPEGWEAASHQNGSVWTLLFYNRDGSAPMTASQALTRLSLQGGGGGVITIQTVITDGNEDRKAPELSITL